MGETNKREVKKGRAGSADVLVGVPLCAVFLSVFGSLDVSCLASDCFVYVIVSQSMLVAICYFGACVSLPAFRVSVFARGMAILLAPKQKYPACPERGFPFAQVSCMWRVPIFEDAVR